MRAGILLYVLVISLILGLFLQFYLENQVQLQRQLMMRKERLMAELMVNLAVQTPLKDQGTLHFDSGEVTYTRLTTSSKSIIPSEAVQRVFVVTLQDGRIISIQK